MERVMIPLMNVELIVNLRYCASDHKLEGRENEGAALFMNRQELTIVNDDMKFKVFIPSRDYSNISGFLKILENMIYNGLNTMIEDKGNEKYHKMTVRISGLHGVLSSLSFTYERRYYQTRRISVQI
jgi:hypothetical protein